MTIPSPSTIEKVLGFVDRPWKIAAVVILAITAILGLTLWEKRAEFAEAVLEDWTNPRLKTDMFTNKFGARLMSDTRADLVVLAEISLKTNLIKDVAGFARDDPVWEPPASPRPFFYTNRDPELLIGLIEGRARCGDIDAQDGEEEQMLARLHMQRRCYIAVPPVLNILVGGLMIAWRQPLGAEAESGAMRVMYQAATQLASW